MGSWIITTTIMLTITTTIIGCDVDWDRLWHVFTAGVITIIIIIGYGVWRDCVQNYDCDLYSDL